MAGIPNRLGFLFEVRSVRRVPAARRECEELVGDGVPLFRFANHSIVRGLARMKTPRMFGRVGC